MLDSVLSRHGAFVTKGVACRSYVAGILISSSVFLCNLFHNTFAPRHVRVTSCGELQTAIYGVRREYGVRSSPVLYSCCVYFVPLSILTQPSARRPDGEFKLGQCKHASCREQIILAWHKAITITAMCYGSNLRYPKAVPSTLTMKQTQSALTDAFCSFLHRSEQSRYPRVREEEKPVMKIMCRRQVTFMLNLAYSLSNRATGTITTKAGKFHYL